MNSLLSLPLITSGFQFFFYSVAKISVFLPYLLTLFVLPNVPITLPILHSTEIDPVKVTINPNATKT